MSYGFVFPKKGYTDQADVRNLAWRDDQQVFLAHERQYKNFTISSGSTLNNQTVTINNLSIPTADYYVFRAYLHVEGNGVSRTYLIDATQEIEIGGKTYIVSSDFSVVSATKGALKTYFLAYNNDGRVYYNVSCTISVYVCLQSVLSSSSAGSIVDHGETGIKISLPGYDVRTCTPKQCSLHSEYTALKARKIGKIKVSSNTWTQIRHDFGYEPAYYGWFVGDAGTIGGLMAFGGSRDYKGGLTEDSRLDSYVTTDSLWVRCSVGTWVYYYLFADLAGKVSNSVPDDDYGDYGLIISQPGVDVRVAKPHQLQFCSAYPNFKLYKEYKFNTTSLVSNKTTQSIGQDDTTIYFQGANKYGDEGKVVLASFETIIVEEWFWTDAQNVEAKQDFNNQVENGLTINIHAEGSTFSGTYSHGSFSGDARWTGDNGSRRFQFYKAGNWNTIDTGWQQSNYGSWGYTWNDGGDGWVECYLTSDPSYHICWYKFFEHPVVNFYQERVIFHGTDDNHFYQCGRGWDGTTKRAWGAGTYVVPLNIRKKIATNTFNYRPTYMGWVIGDGTTFSQTASGLPYGNGDYIMSMVLEDAYNRTLWFTLNRRYIGYSVHDGQVTIDPWFLDSLPEFYPSCFVKIFYDEVGT